MTLRRMLLAGVVVAVGCATTRVSDEQLARLPAQDRAQIVTAQRSIDVADSNVAAAKLARDEAKQFQKIANQELDAANAQLQAARTGIDLGRTARDQRTLAVAGRREDMARDQMVAARAKLDYANRLVDLRQAKVNQAEAALDAARADVELTKVQLLQKDGITPTVNVAKVRDKRERAQSKLADARARVATLEGDVASLRTAWQERRQAYNTAWAGQEPPLHAPPPPRMLPTDQRGVANPPRGGVNDTPAAPETPQSQQPSGGVAPNP